MDDSMEYYLASSNSWRDECPYSSLSFHSPSCICKNGTWDDIDDLTHSIKTEPMEENTGYISSIYKSSASSTEISASLKRHTMIDDSIEYYLSSSNLWQDECPYESLPYHSPSCICKKDKWNELEPLTQTIEFGPVELNVGYNYAIIKSSDYTKTRRVDSIYKCDKCEKSYKTNEGLKYHLKTHDGGKTYKCDICGKGLASNQNLKNHKRTHSGEKPYKCDICDKEFASNQQFQYHIRIHSGERPHKCEVCGKLWQTTQSLNRHRKTHSGEKPYSCEVCGKSFAQSHVLKKHSYIHNGEHPYKCEICGRGFTHRQDLENHERTHSGEKPYKCDICDKCFSQAGGLKQHSYIHSGEHPYKCEICGKGYIYRQLLENHKTHSAEKPNKCDICCKKFATNQQLQYHMRIHSNEYPYKCRICNKSYATKHNLQYHKQSHKGSRYPPHLKGKEIGMWYARKALASKKRKIQRENNQINTLLQDGKDMNSIMKDVRKNQQDSDQCSSVVNQKTIKSNFDNIIDIEDDIDIDDFALV